MELARFQAFDAVAVAVSAWAVAQIDGTTSENIIVGSGPGILSEVKVYRFPLAVPNRRHAVRSSRPSNRMVRTGPGWSTPPVS